MPGSLAIKSDPRFLLNDDTIVCDDGISPTEAMLLRRDKEKEDAKAFLKKQTHLKITETYLPPTQPLNKEAPAPLENSNVFYKEEKGDNSEKSISDTFRIIITEEMESFLLFFKNKHLPTFYTLVALLKKKAYSDNPLFHVAHPNNPNILYLVCKKVGLSKLEILYNRLVKAHTYKQNDNTSPLPLSTLKNMIINKSKNFIRVSERGNDHQLEVFMFKNFSKFELSHKEKAPIYWSLYYGCIPTNSAFVQNIKLDYLKEIADLKLLSQFVTLYDSQTHNTNKAISTINAKNFLAKHKKTSKKAKKINNNCYFGSPQTSLLF